MQIKEIFVASKRSIQVGKEFFTFECSETISVEDCKQEEIEIIKKEAYERCNMQVDDQCLDAKNM